MKYDDSRTKRKKRVELVSIAKKMFLDRGIADTTVIDIVKVAKIERKTFYNYFSSKQELSDYIYYLSIYEFYQNDFCLDVYTSCKSGFEKIKKHFEILVDHYIKYFKNALYAFHYEYHYRKQDVMALEREVIDELSFVYPNEFIDEALADGSVDFKGRDPYDIIWTITQSIGASAARIIFRSTREKVSGDAIDFNALKLLLDIHMESIKSNV